MRAASADGSRSCSTTSGSTTAARCSPATIELWVVARTDAEVRTAMEGVTRDVNRMIVSGAAELFPELMARPRAGRGARDDARDDARSGAAAVHRRRRRRGPALAAGADASARSVRQPVVMDESLVRHRPLVLVPGACLGGWAWRSVAGRLRARGHDVYPVTLTGLGERVHLARAEVDLETHITDVVNLLEYEDHRGCRARRPLVFRHRRHRGRRPLLRAAQHGRLSRLLAAARWHVARRRAAAGDARRPGGRRSPSGATGGAGRCPTWPRCAATRSGAPPA